MSAATTLYDALKLREEANDFKQTFDTLLLSYITEQRQYFASITPNPNLQAIFLQLEAMCTGGKRLRPFMVAKLYSHTHPEAPLTDINHILLAVELVHIFCLIHDDVMDEAPTRHGVATIHQFTRSSLYQHTANNQRSSDSQAILVGDIVFNMVFKLLHTTPPSGVRTSASIQALFHTLIDEVCLGQMLDIDLTTNVTATELAVVEKNRLKTAYYSFVRPLHIGAVLSGRDDLIPFIIEFGEAVGLLYQVEDDLLDIIGEEAVTKKPTFGDVTQNQHTVLTAFMRAQGGTAASLLNSKAGFALKDEDKTELRASFINEGAVAYAEALTSKYSGQARAAMDRHTLSPHDQSLFMSVLTLVTKRTT